MKNLKILIVIITIIIIIIVIALFTLIPKLKDQIEESENLNYGDVLDIQQETTDKAYVIIENCIEKYLQYNIEKNSQLESILEKIVDYEEFDEIYYLKIVMVYKIERMNDTTYFVDTLLNNENEYFVVNVDYINRTFSIRKTSQDEFNNAKNNKVDDKYKESITIEKNNYNAIDSSIISKDKLIDKYYEVYKKLALNKPEVAFEMLDSEYKSNKFNNDIENYKEYVENNKNRIQNSTIVDMELSQKENYTEYKIQDDNNNIYIIKEYSHTDFSIILDNYTITSQEEKDKYLKLTAKEKVVYNIEKVFQMLDNKDYIAVYNLLDTGFKNTNFKTYEAFKAYAQENFFDNNILGNITVEEQGENYIIIVPYKDGVSSAAKKNKKTFVMRLLEETNFVMSFEVE